MTVAEMHVPGSISPVVNKWLSDRAENRVLTLVKFKRRRAKLRVLESIGLLRPRWQELSRNAMLDDLV